ncbi:hypothetical protein [Pseudobythopirellula maris]|uniref:hypothetical protein n=1 Tax=Pseudobythopirellula maris TaxID=2527991 RepID=UPI0011B37452|nr:hypothetical protein [Pseudobythopirellula maris]
MVHLAKKESREREMFRLYAEYPKRFLLPFVMVVLSWGPVFGATVFTDRIMFEAASGPLMIEGFEGATLFETSGSAMLDLGIVSVAYEGERPFGVLDIVGFVPGSTTTEVGPTEGQRYLLATFATSVTFVFEELVFEFGTDLKDVESTINYLTSSGESGVAGVQMDDGVVQFFGFRSDTGFSSIRFTNDKDGDGMIFDHVVFTGVPEPSTAFLSIWAFLAASFYREPVRTSLTTAQHQ